VVVNRQKFNRGDAEVREMGNRRFTGQAGIVPRTAPARRSSAVKPLM
jgi:hypothetical protein